MQFSKNGNELACGCSDGMLRVWNVWTGEQPSLRGHWPGEAVIAVSFSNGNTDMNNNNNDSLPLLASSSTDHTIRLWKQRQVQQRPRGPWGDKKKSISTTSEDSSLENITIQIRDAGHAFTLIFSPDDSYLVSGHHSQQQQQQQRRRRQRDPLDEERHGNNNDNIDQRQQARNQPQNNALIPETIYLWSVATGLQLRRLDQAGMPISFLQSSPLTAANSEHRLLSTCAGESLKLWSLGSSSSGSGNKKNKRRQKAQCLQRLYLDGYSTVMPVPTMDCSTTVSSDDDDLDNSNHSLSVRSSSSTTTNDIMVATIDGQDSFSVWNTGGHDCDCVRNPKNCTCHDLEDSLSSLSSHDSGSSRSSSCKRVQHSFQNTSPYEIRFSNNCSKVASVDNFNRVKVWNVQSGKLLKTFVQQQQPEGSLSSSRHTAGVDLLSNSDESSEHGTSSRGQGLPGGFPIHELAFCQDSAVAVVSRFYNEIHLFST